MDTNKKQNKATGRGGSAADNNLANLQQHMALAAQLGIAPALMDPAALQNLGAPSDLALQRMLAMQAGGVPLMNPGAALAFGGLGGIPSSGILPGNMGGPDWMAMAQQAQLLSMFGGGLSPAMLSQLLGVGPGQGNLRDGKSATPYKEPSSRKRPLSQSPAHVHKDPSRPDSNSSTSRLASSGMLSPGPSNQAQPISKSRPQPSPAHTKDNKGGGKEFDGIPKNQAETDQMIQREMMKQMEQQFMFQQLQLKQQQNQIQAALSVINIPTDRQSSGGLRVQREDTSQSDKLQQQLSESIYQQLLSGSSGLPGVAASMPPYFGSSQAMEQLMGLSQHSSSSTKQIASQPATLKASTKPPQSSSSYNKTQIKKDPSISDYKSSSTIDQKPNTLPPLGSANNTPFTGDPNTDVFLAAIFDQFQQQGITGSKNPSSNFTEPKREQTDNHEKASDGFSLSDKLRSSYKDKSIKHEQGIHSSILSPHPPVVTTDASHRRRKQANPTSISGLSKGDVKSTGGKMKNGQRSGPSSRNSHSLDAIENSDLPVSLVKSKPDLKSLHRPAAEGLNLHSGDRDMPKTSEKQLSLNSTNEKCSNIVSNISTNQTVSSPGTISEKAGSATLTQEQDKLSIPHSLEGVDKVILSAYNNLLAGGRPNDLNKLNDLLTATVAAEMGRLQTQQINLTRELEMLSKQEVAGKDNEMKKRQSLGKEDKEAASISKLGGVTPRDTDSLVHKVKDTQTTILSDKDSGEKMKHVRDFGKEEENAMLPLDRGWKREVHFQHFNNELSGKVCYISPEGRKMNTFEDILKHLDDNDVTYLQRDNFSFDPRLRVGAFYEQKGDSKEWTEIPKDELEQVWRLLGQGGPLGNKLQSSTSQLLIAARNRCCEIPADQDDSAKLATEEKLWKAAEERSKHAELKVRQMDEQKSRAKLLRQQKSEHQRLEREARERQLLEERQKQEAARQLARYQEAIRKTKARESQRQAEVMEREQRRQHLVLLKALETKRRAEERDRRREEIKNERMFIKEKKMEQRQLAMKLARELKMPVEDMCLNNHRIMPKLDPLQGTVAEECDPNRRSQLSGAATADILMVLEFLHTFKDAIFIDENVIPTFEELRRGLLNDSKYIGSLVQLTMALLHQCLCDPGVPAPGPWLHCLVGLKVTDVDVSKGNYSEILRLFLWARNGNKTEVARLLETEPFPSLTPDQKASTLAFMVNELVCSAPICSDIEKHLDNLVTLRRDKWVVEGKIRQARIEEANAGSDASSPSKSISKHKTDEDTEKEDSSKDDDSAAGETKPTCRSDTLIQRKMKKLTKEHQSFNERMYRSSKPLRSLEIGQDRYKRRYWVLAHMGGVYVEGLESGQWYDNEEKEEEEMKEDTKESAGIEMKTEAIEPPAVVADESNLMCLSEAALLRINMEKEAAKSEIIVSGNLSHTQPSYDIKQDSKYQLSQSSQSFNKILAPNKSTDLPLNGHDQRASTLSMSLNVKSDLQTTVSEPAHLSTAAASTCQSCNKVEIPSLISSVTGSTVQAAATVTTSVSLPVAAHNDIGSDVVQIETLSSVTSHCPVGLSTNQNDVGQVANTEDLSSPCSVSSSKQKESISSIDLKYCTASSNSQRVDYDIGGGGGASAHSDSNLTNLNCIVDAVAASKPPVEDKSSSNSGYVCGPHSKSSSRNQIFNQISEEEQKRSKTDTNTEKKEDSVEAAARAIAAKAVASTSHLLFPQAMKSNCDVISSPSTSPTTDGNKGSSEKATNSETEKDTLTLESVFENIPGLSNHMAKALESIGIDATNLSQQQLQALMHIKNNEGLERFVPKKANEVDNSGSSNITRGCTSKEKPITKVATEQDRPIDLSKPTVTAASSEAFSKSVSTSPLPSRNVNMPNIKPQSLDDPLFKGNPLTHMFDPTMIMMSKLNPIIKAEFDRMHFPNDDAIVSKPKDVNDKPSPVPKELKRGWWRIHSEEKLDAFCESLHARGRREKHLHRGIMKYRKFCLDAMEVANSPGFQLATDPQCSKETTKENELSLSVPSDEENTKAAKQTVTLEPTLECPTEMAYLIEMETLNQVEELADRCHAVGILGQSWKATPKASTTEQGLAHIPYQCPDDSAKHDWSTPIRHDPNSVLSFIVDLLTMLELSILRMYLKPPLIRKGGSSEFSNLPSLSEAGADVAAGLRTWRNAVATATSAAQLSMCSSMLESCVAWEKTVKCVKPESSPKLKKKRGEKRSNCKLPVSGSTKKKKTQRTLECASLADSEDSLHDMESALTNRKSPEKKSGSDLHNVNSLNDDDYRSDDSALLHGEKLCDSPLPEEKDALASYCDDPSIASEIRAVGQGEDEENVKKKKKKNKRKNKDKNKPEKPKKKKSTIGFLKELLLDLQKHEMATWFLFPVDLKLVPEYKKFIKRPMDFSLIESRMKRGRYKTGEQFAEEVRIIFDNCQLFNEDDSPIGRAGHTMRSYFENKWAELEKTLDVTEEFA